MERTGESYQQALSRLRRERPVRVAPGRDVDLIPIDYFGLKLTLASFEILGDWSCVVISAAHLSQPFPRSPLFALSRQRGLG
ncbi:MAG TPA: hypothetical protein VFK05_38730 [Polyangiaceae bacterium]|nr:hypothetical protein [Polyangiaceae bacterium]